MTDIEGDFEFEDSTVTAVSGSREHGWSITKADGWSFHVPKDSPVEPTVGMAVRMYGRGTGYAVRGLALDGQTVFYRTEAEDKEHSANQMYGKDAAEWLRRWDDGQGVWSVEMGGLGPSYEQAIQVTAMEIMRDLIETKADASEWNAPEKWKAQVAAFDERVMPRLLNLGLSGAQWGAAISLATTIYKRGPRDALSDEAVKDRKIQISNGFEGIKATIGK